MINSVSFFDDGCLDRLIDGMSDDFGGMGGGGRSVWVGGWCWSGVVWIGSGGGSGVGYSDIAIFKREIKIKIEMEFSLSKFRIKRSVITDGKLIKTNLNRVKTEKGKDEFTIKSRPVLMIN